MPFPFLFFCPLPLPKLLPLTSLVQPSFPPSFLSCIIILPFQGIAGKWRKREAGRQGNGKSRRFLPQISHPLMPFFPLTVYRERKRQSHFWHWIHSLSLSSSPSPCLRNFLLAPSPDENTNQAFIRSEIVARLSSAEHATL